MHAPLFGKVKLLRSQMFLRGYMMIISDMQSNSASTCYLHCGEIIFHVIVLRDWAIQSGIHLPLLLCLSNVSTWFQPFHSTRPDSQIATGESQPDLNQGCGLNTD